MAKMYELVGMYKDLLEAELDESVFNDTLEGLEGDIEDKVDNIACIIKELNADTDAIKQEEKRLAERRKAKENKATRLKEYLHNSLEAMGKSRIETARNLVTVRKNPAKLIIAEDFIEKNYEYVETVEEFIIDKGRLKEDLKAGKIVQGARLEQGTSLNIK